MKHFVLLFCDPGIDDALAMMYAMMHPDIELVGVVPSYGNVTKEQAVRNTAYLLHLAGMNHIPIIPAAFKSFTEFNEKDYSEIHGTTGLGEIPLPDYFPGNIHSFDMVRELCRTYKHDLTIVEIGRMTALSLAYNLFKEEIDGIKAVYIMGGAFFIPGNRTPVAEANVFGDSNAARFVFEHLSTIVTPLNVTSHAVISNDLYWKLINHPVFGKTIEAILSHYGNYYSAKMPFVDGPPIHDLLPLILMVNPRISTYLYRDITVITQSEAKGMTMIDLREDSKPGRHQIAWSLHKEMLMKEFEWGMFARYTDF